MRVYISGKISGKTYDEAAADFEYYEHIISDYGHEAVNPMKNGLPFDASWADHMERDLASLKTCDAICLLPDWVISTGAQIEVRQALAADMLLINDTNLISYLQAHTQTAQLSEPYRSRWMKSAPAPMRTTPAADLPIVPKPTL